MIALSMDKNNPHTHNTTLVSNQCDGHALLNPGTAGLLMVTDWTHATRAYMQVDKYSRPTGLWE